MLADPIHFKISEYISTYTNNYVYLSDANFITSLISREEIEERYLSALRFYGYSPGEAEIFFRGVGGGGLFLGLRVSPLFGGDPEKNEQYVRRLKNKYARVLQEDRIQVINYKADYALVGAPQGPGFLGEKSGSLRVVYDDGLFKILKLRGTR